MSTIGKQNRAVKIDNNNRLADIILQNIFIHPSRGLMSSRKILRRQKQSGTRRARLLNIRRGERTNDSNVRGSMSASTRELIANHGQPAITSWCSVGQRSCRASHRPNEPFGLIPPRRYVGKHKSQCLPYDGVYIGSRAQRTHIVIIVENVEMQFFSFFFN